MLSQSWYVCCDPLTFTPVRALLSPWNPLPSSRHWDCTPAVLPRGCFFSACTWGLCWSTTHADRHALSPPCTPHCLLVLRKRRFCSKALVSALTSCELGDRTGEQGKLWAGEPWLVDDGKQSCCNSPLVLSPGRKQSLSHTLSTLLRQHG